VEEEKEIMWGSSNKQPPDEQPLSESQDEGFEIFDQPTEIARTISGRRSPWRLQRRTLVVASGILVTVILASVILLIFTHSLPTKPTYNAAHVTRGSLTISFKTTGQLQNTLYDVNFASSGRVATILAKVGQKVKKGDSLAKLDTAELQQGVDEANAKVTAARTAVNNAQANLTQVQVQTNADLTVAQNQLQTDIANCQSDQTCITRANDKYTAAKALANQKVGSAQHDLSEAQSQLDVAQVQLNNANHNLQNATLVAPHDGTIAAINGRIGTVTTVSTPSIPFMQIADLSSLQIAATANEHEIANIAIGNDCIFTVKSIGKDTVFQGKVSEFSPVGQGQGVAPTYPITIDVDQESVQNVTLFSGMVADVTIITTFHPNVILIPSIALSYTQSAVQHNSPVTKSQLASAKEQGALLLGMIKSELTPDEIAQDHPTLAFVVQQRKDKWEVKPVIVGLSNGAYTEVIRGLTTTEMVIVGEGNVKWPLVPTAILTPTPDLDTFTTPTVVPTIRP
jgi:HlyD family secretion protein